ncbi:aspartate/glutamate racemase family protein [Bradyrhizobium sp. NAS96.2]|uniref:maleate cis-trans isomerase family protein n=1 Tax=Bradyrhizobium sp. NAS96.2 TaxID=1680160 RepID=UPI0009F93EC4|nr:aspartate/glutamate racemase family protein [Bradyrhizobium sp. NAS96.2]
MHKLDEKWLSVPYQLDSGFGVRAHIGMVVISNDQTLSHEAREMLRIPGVALYESRISSSRRRGQTVSTEILARQADQIDGAVRQINEMRPSDVIALGCTSASMVIGQDELQRRIRSVHPKALVTDPFTGIKAALRSLRASHVAFVSPYPREVALQMVRAIESTGTKVTSICTFCNETGFIADEAPFISPESIVKAVQIAAARADADVIVVACTQMRAAAILTRAEQETGKRVISSNQALCWHALRLAGCEDTLEGWGSLFQKPILAE